MRKPCRRALAAVLALLLALAAAGCSREPAPSSSIPESSSSQSASSSAPDASGDGAASTENTEDSHMSTTATTKPAGGKTTAAKTTAKPTPTTTTAKTPSKNPGAAQVGSADFKPGSLYKGPVVNFRKDGDATTLGAWWWTLKGIVEPIDGVSVDMVLDMLIANKVTEIYLDVSAMMPWDEEEAQGGLTDDDKAAGLVSERYVRGFVKKCAKYNIRVAALTGASGDSVLRWIDPDKKNYQIKAFAEKIAGYQSRAAKEEKFYAIHLDVEPHTMGSKWDNNRAKYTQWMADMVVEARKQCDAIGVQLEYDVWSWFTEADKVTDESGATVNILDLMTKKCHALGIMSYYNTGAGQFDRATNVELAYAKKNNCRLIAGTETIKITPTNITYYYSGKDKLVTEQGVLRQKLDGTGYNKLGGAIHHVYSWYELMTK